MIAVSGGTAISLFLSRRIGIDAFQVWKALHMPHAFVLGDAPWRLETTIG